jgi:hypothetical protein
MSKPWKPREDLVIQSRGALERALGDAARDGAAALTALGEAGALVAMGQGGTLVAVGAGELFSAIERALTSIDLGALDDAAVDLRTMITEVDEASPEATAAFSRALEARHAFALKCLGFQALAGRKPPLTTDQETALMAFEDLVRPEIWRATAFNLARGEALAQIEPGQRPLFWWLSDGVAVDPRAAGAMASVAHLVARFPAARKRFEALVQVESSLAEGTANVIDFATWIARSRAAREPGGRMRVAAAPALDQIPVLATSDCNIFWREPSTLIVDVLKPTRPEAVPHLTLPDRTRVHGEPVARAVDRFRFVLEPSALRGGPLVLSLPLVAGDMEVRLPAADGT